MDSQPHFPPILTLLRSFLFLFLNGVCMNSHNATTINIIPAIEVGAAGNLSINPCNVLIQSYHTTGVITAFETILSAALSAWPPNEWLWTSTEVQWLTSGFGAQFAEPQGQAR